MHSWLFSSQNYPENRICLFNRSLQMLNIHAALYPCAGVADRASPDRCIGGQMQSCHSPLEMGAVVIWELERGLFSLPK